MKTIVNKPWGSFEIINEGIKYTVKKIIVNPGGQLSMQSHEHRSEHWLIAEGYAEVIINEETFNLHANQHIFIPKGAIHRIQNPNKKPVKIMEAQLGSILKETDIVRYEDIYGRAN